MRSRHPFVVAAFAASLVLAPAAGAGEIQLEPGLWEVENDMAAAGGQLGAAQAELKRQLAAMPPEQRAMMEKMMAGQGVDLGGKGLLGVTGRICLTREMIDQHELPVQKGKCTTKLLSRTGNSVKMSFECTDPPAHGEGEYTILSPKAYEMKMAVRAAIQGQEEKMTMDATGKWLGADCGSVKPRAWSTAPR